MPNIKGTLNPAPQGLLSLLSMKSRGTNPDTLLDSVQPVIDLSHWYGLDRTECAVVDLALASSAAAQIRAFYGSLSTLTVPRNEVWWVRDYQVSILDTSTNITAVDVQNFCGVLNRPEVSSVSPVTNTLATGRSLNRFQATYGAGSPNPFWLPAPALQGFWAPPGSIFGFYMAGFLTLSAGSTTVRGAIAFDRMLL